MKQPPFPFYTIYLALLLFQNNLPAQPREEFKKLTEKIDRFLEAEQQDSFLYYSYKKADLAQRSDSLRIWAWTRCKMRRIYRKEPALAIQCLQESIALYEKGRSARTQEEWEPVLELYLRLSMALLDAGNIFKAGQSYEKTRAIAEQHRTPDFDLVEYIYKPMGNCYTRLGENEKSIAIFQKALPVVQAAQKPDVLAGLYLNIGVAYWNQNDYAAAAANYQQGLQIAGISADKRALLRNGLACNQLDEGQVTQALQNATEALRLLGPLGKAAQGEHSNALLLAAQANIRLGKYGAAQRLLTAALSEGRSAGILPRDLGKMELTQATLYRLQHKPMAALEACNRALSVVLPAFQPHTVVENPSAASFYEENTIIEALEKKAAAAVDYYAKDPDLKWLQLALECHDLAYVAETRLRNVFQYRSSKLGLQNAARNREQAAMDVTRLLYEKTNDPAYITKAFTIAERSKSALLREALQQNLAQRQSAIDDVRFVQLNGLKHNIADLEKSLLLTPQDEQVRQWQQQRDELLAELHALEKQLQNDPIVGLKTPQQESGLADFKTFPANETVLEYFVSETTMDVLVLTAGQAPVWKRFAYDAQLKQLHQQFTAYFASAAAILKDPDGYLHTAYALWQIIVPAAAQSAECLTIVPDGFLNFIPFEALVTATPGTSLRNAAYLVRRQQVRYAWSLASLQTQNALHSRASNALLGIAPLFANGERGLTTLDAGAREWAGFSTRQLLGDQATHQQLLSEVAQYRVLHFSTHAFANDPPRIELYDQALLLPDLYAMPLDADLVVLSACETGLGAEQKGEGVMSLARAFGQSGASCIISSLWRVNDQSTARLFAAFYQFLADGETTDGALQHTKLAYLNDPAIGAQQQTPYFWAGFVAVGADRTIHLDAGFWQLKIVGWLLGGGLLLGWLLWAVRRKKALQN